MATERLYQEMNDYLSEVFPFKVQKISIHAGFTCPNRDGSIGVGGCTYCNNQTFNPAYCMPTQSVAEQLEEGKRFFARKYPSMKYLAYFQAYTNTYAALEVLKQRYEEALAVPDVVGLVIGTRPDCMPSSLLDYLEELNHRTFLMVEYGIESTDDNVLRNINRGHTYEQAVQSVVATSQRGIRVGAHVIVGLPGEDYDALMLQARTVSSLPLTTLKMHQLQLIKGTRMAQQYAQSPQDFCLYEVDEYIELIIDYMEQLRPDIVLDRFVSQSPVEWLIAPHWGIKNHVFVDKLKKRMRQRNTYQGRLFTPGV